MDKITVTQAELSHNPDAAIWAKSFCEHFPDGDEGLMIGWFANAMMAMHDYLMQRYEWNTRHNDAQMAAPDALAKVRAALGQYQEAPFRSADWLANRLMDIFNADGMKGEGPCLGTTKQTSDTHKGLAEKLKAVGDADLTSGAFRLAKDNLTDFVIRNSEAILTSLSASNAPFDASEQRVDDHQTGLSLKGGQQAHDSNAMREALAEAYQAIGNLKMPANDPQAGPLTHVHARIGAALANTPKLDPQA